MRRITKNVLYSTKYKEWEEQLEASNTRHPKYSSKFKFYRDVVMELFRCQNGLCAYTEMKLGVDAEDVTADKWRKGRYLNRKLGYLGHLEHFDENLKAKDTAKEGIQDWLWDNLFMVHSDINTKVKGKKAVYSILKPDATHYDPFELLDYNKDMHFFTPNYENQELTATDLEQIKIMIEVLGLNFDPIFKCRRDYFTEIFKDMKEYSKTWDTVTIQFPTAFAMMRQKLQAQN